MPRRRSRERETGDWLNMLRRMIAAAGRRVADADEVELGTLLGMRHDLDKAIALRNAVEATLTALHDANLLEPRHAAVAQLALELADSVSAGKRSGRASAAAMAAAQLLAALDALPKPAGLDADAEWNAFVAELHRVGSANHLSTQPNEGA